MLTLSPVGVTRAFAEPKCRRGNPNPRGPSANASRVGLPRRRPAERGRSACVRMPSNTNQRWSAVVACLQPDAERYTPKRLTRAPTKEQEERWQARFEELRKFKEDHGHLVVPRKEPHASLKHWVFHQRKMRRERTLSEARESALDELGLCWEPPRGRRRDHGKPRFTFHDEQWQAMLNELRAFNEANGHFKVTRDDLKLYNWAHEQRRKEKRGELADYRRAALESIGFELRSKANASWDERFAELRAFREENGHCSVPATWRHNKLLGGWVYRQRKYRRNGTLRKEKQAKLESLGFEWEPKSSGGKSSRAAFHVREKVSPWATQVKNTASSPEDESSGGAEVQWMGDDEPISTPFVNGWGKASSAYEEKQQFVFNRIDDWWRGNEEDENCSASRRRVRAMRYNYAVVAKQRTIKPDIVIEVEAEESGDIWGLVIEVDEFAHKRGKHYSWRAEEERMQDLQAILGVPLKIVRFNPDPTSANPMALEDRTETLVEHVAESVLQSAPRRDLEVEYFLYD